MTSKLIADLVDLVEEVRNQALEDAARLCDHVYLKETAGDYYAGVLADRIRALKTKEGT